jgi:hypothetical protein
VGGGVVITKTFITAKDFRTYSIRILRQEKILRDHGSNWLTEV